MEKIDSCLPVDCTVEEDMKAYIIELTNFFLSDTSKTSLEDFQQTLEPFLTGSGFTERQVETFCYGSRMLLNQTHFFLKESKKYALVGENGVGKTTLLTRMGKGDITGWPTHLTSILIRNEIEGSLNFEKLTVKTYLKQKALKLNVGDDVVEVALETIGFTDKTQWEMEVQNLSGGWKIRLSLAETLLRQPDILLLDEPTNHLDVEATTWLIKHLKNCESVVVMISHDESFLNSVATDVIWFHNQSLKYFENCTFKKFQSKRAALIEKNSLTSKERNSSSLNVSSKLLNENSKELFKFPKPGSLGTLSSRTRTILYLENVFFRFDPSSQFTLSNIGLNVNLNSKIGICGPNGAGKSTLLKLIVGDLNPEKGILTRHDELRISYVNQHSMNHLEQHTDLTPISYIQERFRMGFDNEFSQKDTIKLTKEEVQHNYKKGDLVQVLSRFRKHKDLCYQVIIHGTQKPVVVLQSAITNPRELKMIKLFEEKYSSQVAGIDQLVLTKEELIPFLKNFGICESIAKGEIKRLSGGQCSKLVLAASLLKRPHLIVLDEPTNYIDKETLVWLVSSLKSFKGAVVVVSHQNSFVDQFCNEKWNLSKGILSISKL